MFQEIFPLVTICIIISNSTLKISFASYDNFNTIRNFPVITLWGTFRKTGWFMYWSPPTCVTFWYSLMVQVNFIFGTLYERVSFEVVFFFNSLNSVDVMLTIVFPKSFQVELQIQSLLKAPYIQPRLVSS